jgi:hypothetical protein
MEDGHAVFSGFADSDTAAGFVVTAPNPLRTSIDLEQLARITP